MSRVPAGDRLQRLLSIVPWVADHPEGVAVDEICERFDVPRRQLLDDLDVVWMVGVHPFTPAEMIEVVVEDDRVWIHYADWFRRPLRLTPEQGLALVASGSSLLSVPGADPAGPLARALDKLAASLGVDTADLLDVDLGPAEADILRLVEEATRERRRVELDYYAYGRDERAVRVVEPHRVFADQGHWYLTGFCQRAGGDRVFRVDRIRTARLLDERFDPPADSRSTGVFAPGPDDPRIVLDVAPEGRWIAEQYPCESIEPQTDGGLRVTLAVTATGWIERLLLRLGPHATVVSAPDDLRDVGSAAARRILDRYQS